MVIAFIGMIIIIYTTYKVIVTFKNQFKYFVAFILLLISMSAAKQFLTNENSNKSTELDKKQNNNYNPNRKRKKSIIINM